jgi:hypothetical protein
MAHILKRICYSTCLLTFAGCVFIFHNYASVVGPLPAYHNEYRIRLQQVEGPMAFNLHAGAFGRSIVLTDFRLPHAPSGVDTFSFDQVIVVSDDPARRVPLVGGSMRVDTGHKTVVIAYQTKDGESPVNGSYPLHTGQ